VHAPLDRFADLAVGRKVIRYRSKSYAPGTVYRQMRFFGQVQKSPDKSKKRVFWTFLDLSKISHLGVYGPGCMI
jgi:hypothetical protein